MHVFAWYRHKIMARCAFKNTTDEATKTIAKIHARMLLEQDKGKKEWYKK